MGKGTTQRTPVRAVSRASRQTAQAPAANRTRSFPCPDDLWHEVEAFANERGLGSPAAATRLLLQSGLGMERRVRELQAARDWQIEQAAEQARLRAREREAAVQQVAARA